MNERVIATTTPMTISGGEEGHHRLAVAVPDPEAPSVADIVELLEDAKAHINGTAERFSAREKTPMLYRIDNLIARLEGA